MANSATAAVPYWSARSAVLPAVMMRRTTSATDLTSMAASCRFGLSAFRNDAPGTALRAPGTALLAVPRVRVPFGVFGPVFGAPAAAAAALVFVLVLIS